MFDGQFQNFSYRTAKGPDKYSREQARRQMNAHTSDEDASAISSGKHSCLSFP
jgi:hypothetical protein